MIDEGRISNYLETHGLDGTLSEHARDLLYLLLRRYNETGSKFLYVHATYDTVLASTGLSLDAIDRAGKELASSGVCYYHYDKILKDIKLGLKVPFLKVIERKPDKGGKVESVQHAGAMQVSSAVSITPCMTPTTGIRIGPASAKRIHHRRFGTKEYALPPDLCRLLNNFCTRTNPRDRGKWHYYQDDGFTLAITPKGKAQLRVKQHPHIVFRSLASMLGKEKATQLAGTLMDPESKSFFEYTHVHIEYPLEDPAGVLAEGKGRWYFPDGRQVEVFVDRSPGYPVFEVKGDPKASETLGDITAEPAYSSNLLISLNRKIDLMISRLEPHSNPRPDRSEWSFHQFLKCLGNVRRLIG